jgi:hypothetical protein
LGERGGKTKQMEAALLAGLFELGGKLRAAIDLDGANGKRRFNLRGGCNPPIDLRFVFS